MRWQAWQPGLHSGAHITFDAPGRSAQYRLNSARGCARRAERPQCAAHRLARARHRQGAGPEPPPAAPTYRIRGTRMGMVGGRTANGHASPSAITLSRCRPGARFLSKGGNEYMVRITYNGRSSVAPVYDVGPWNVHDNYWTSSASASTICRAATPRITRRTMMATTAVGPRRAR